MSAPEIELTLFRKENGPLTKRIWLEADGSVKSDGRQCIMSRGWAWRIGLDNLQGLADALNNFRPEQAIATGTLRPDLPDQVEVVTKHQLNGRTDLIARSQDYLVYRAGCPTLVLIDFDRKGMPPMVAQRMRAAGGVWNALCQVLPKLEGVGRVGRASTSAGLYNAETGQTIEGSGGYHYYILIKNGADAERFLKNLHQRCWIADFGWFLIGKAGQLLERSLIDYVCGGPERLVFEGGPVVISPLAQDQGARHATVVDGEQLDTIVDCPLLSSVEQARLREIHAKERHRLAGDCAKARELFVTSQASLLAERTGMDLGRARKVVERHCDGVLLPYIELPFDDPKLKGKTVADVLADPARFEGETLADPIEGVEYGMGKARIMRRADGSVWIHSFAHGRATYDLRLDFASVKAALEKTEKDAVAHAFVHFVLAADLNDIEVEQLKTIAAKSSGVGVRILASALKAAREQLAARRGAEKRRRGLAERRDPRPSLPAPLKDAEWLPVMGSINEVLSRCPTPEPPTRDFEGFLNTCRTTRAPGLHSLTSSGANATEVAEDRIPPSEQLRLTRLDEIEAAELIERHIEYVEASEDSERPVHLHPSFVKHYFKRREDPALPRVYTIVQMPLVLPNGEILSGQGLNRDMNAIFRVPNTLKVPDPQKCKPPDVSKAMRFLIDNWLCDVNTSYYGKCVIVALCETIIERALLPLRPGFFVSGGKRGGGKTTTLSMASMATLGTVAPAAAWSPSEEERRKAVLSYFLEDDPFVVFDNIKRGFVVFCPHIERALTAEFFADRILGASERKIVPVTTVFAWTGNNIAPRGDLSSRVLSVPINVDRPDPENRAFNHPDPIGWTSSNRGKLLYAFYTILLGNPRRAQPIAERGQAPTRFKAWWDLVGSAIEHAASICAAEDHGLVADRNPICPAEKIDFAKQMIDSEADDDENSGLSELLTTLKERWPNGFMARNLASCFCPHDSPPTEIDRNLQSCLELAAGAPLRPVSSNTVSAALRKMTDAPVKTDDQTTLVLRCSTKDRKNGDTFRVETFLPPEGPGFSGERRP